MNKKQIEQQLAADLQNNIPDVWDRISERMNSPLAEPEFEPVLAGAPTGTPSAHSPQHRMKLRAALFSSLALILAAVVLMVTLLSRSAPPVTIQYPETGYVVIDINPSVQLVLGSDGKVKNVKALNYDAQVLLRSNEDKIIGKSAESASTAVLELAKTLGYISVDKKNNAMLIAVSLADSNSEAALKGKIRDTLKEDFSKQGIYGVVLTDIKSKGYAEKAEKYGITESKMRLIISAEKIGVVFTEAEKPTISVSAIYERMAERSKELENAGSEELSERLEELEEQGEEALEMLTEEIENLLEQMEDFDDAENAAEKLEDILEQIEDGGDTFSILKQLTKELDQIETTDTGLKKLLSDIKRGIQEKQEAYDSLLSDIEKAKTEIIEKQRVLENLNADKNHNHKKDDNFDDDFEDWYEENNKRYVDHWDELKAAWESEFDD